MVSAWPSLCSVAGVLPARVGSLRVSSPTFSLLSLALAQGGRRAARCGVWRPTLRRRDARVGFGMAHACVSVCPAGGVFRESITRNTEMASTGTDMITTSISRWLVCVWAGRLPPNHRLGRCTQDSRQTGLLSFTHSLAALGHQLRREGAHLGLVDRTLALGLLQARVVLLQRALGGKRGGGRRPTTAGAGAAPCPRGLGASRGAPAGPSQSQAAQTPASPARRPTCACRWCCGFPALPQSGC